jgi:amino acid adenylation domain-containing protein
MESNHPSSQRCSGEETSKLVREWNLTEMEIDTSKCIHDLLADQAQRTPDKTAVVFRDRTLTYQALAERAELLACHLRGLGVGRDTIVAICMDRSIDTVTALWAVLKAGGAYLPVDPSYPAERVQFMLSDSEARVILTERKMQTRFEGQRAVILCVDGDIEREPLAAIDRGSHSARPEDLAYLMYTSGSTGTPKGVMIEHRNLVNFCAAMEAVVGRGPGVWLAVTSISFDISVLELLWTLTRGFTVVVQAEEDKLSLAGKRSVADLMERFGVTHLQCTPTLARMLFWSKQTPAAMKSLRKLLVGGEALPVALANQLRDALEAEIYNMYGPTETTVWSTSHKLEGSSEVVPIGRPIANTQVYLLDDERNLVTIGEVGELYIGGAGVARGYWKRDELTAERFLPNPFSDRPGDRLYRTGDLARYRADGSIEFLGRIDHQVKIRGFRIELGEIETALGKHPAVQDVVAVPRQDADGNQLVLAYVVVRPEHHVSPREMQLLARRTLPEYMVPSVVTLLDRMPVTPNGKVDRKALLSRAAAAAAYGATTGTRTELESMLSQIWKSALDVGAVSLQANLFELGATSLMVADAAATIGRALNREIRVTDLFAYPTIGSLAAYLSGAGGNGCGDETGEDRGAARRAALARRTRTAAARSGLDS